VATETSAALIRLFALCQANINMVFDHRGRLLDPSDWPVQAWIAVRSLHGGRNGVGVEMHDSSAALSSVLDYLAALKRQKQTNASARAAALERALVACPDELRRVIERGYGDKVMRFMRTARRQIPLRYRVGASIRPCRARSARSAAP
jgi:hypothetical protein